MFLSGAASARELLGLRHASKSGFQQIEGLSRASGLSSSNWRYPLYLGGLQARMGQSKLALDSYLEATRRFPACGPCWVGVAETRLALGQDPLPALSSAIGHGRSRTSVRTRAAVIYSKLGLDEPAAEEFSAALGGRRTDRGEFYSLLNRLYAPDYVLDRIITDAELETYLPFAQRVLSPALVARVWERYEKRQHQDGEQRERYVRYLLNRGMAHDAWSVAFGSAASPHGTVLNGDFERRSEAEPLGWRVSDGEGVRAAVVGCSDCRSGSRALRLRFDGEHNVHYFGVSQSLPVAPGATYSLTARVKHSEITSAAGPQLLVLGLGDKTDARWPVCEMWSASEPFLRDQDWHDIAIEFTVPSTCEGVRIFVARRRTDRLSRLIGGELWVDDVFLTVRPVQEPSQHTGRRTPAAAS